MLTITLRDLQFRRRQTVIAVLGAGLVFALALLLTGVRAGFRTEAMDTVNAFRGDGWLVAKGVTGPFTSVSAIHADAANELSHQRGVRAAAPLIALPQTIDSSGDLLPVNLIGVEPDGLGAPEVDHGDRLARDGQVVVSTLAGYESGDRISVVGRRYSVVGEVEGASYLAGVPIVYMTLHDAQRLAFDGRALAGAIVFQGSPGKPLPGLVELSNNEVESDLLRPLEGATGAIDLLRVLMWLVAAVIIGAVVYLSALDRLRDFAVLKAVGGTSRSLAASMALEAVIIAVFSAALAAVIALLLGPLFPLPVTISPAALVATFLIALAVGVVSSLGALRRVLAIDPALAFS